MGGRFLVVCAIVGAVLALAPAALADAWLPHPAGATWTWQWTDTAYSPDPTTEKVDVNSQKGSAFTLAWRVDGQNGTCDAKDPTVTGTVTFQETNSGLNTFDWCSTPPPPQFPVLCSTTTRCPNSLASVYYNVVWGSLRNAVLAEPLLKGLAWSTTGGAQNDVAAVSTYLGTEQVTVPAFPAPVTAAKVQTQISQAGAIGDPYGSGVRTVWWVYGVGPVKVLFQHAGGTNAPVTTAVLQSTNQAAQPPPGDANYFPLTRGSKVKYRWTNTKHLSKPEVQQLTVDAVANGSARFTVKDVSGPIRVAGAYAFSTRLDGVTNLYGSTQSATRLKFPPLGPAGASSDKRIHFVTPFDLMNFGFNPLLPAYPKVGDTWGSQVPSRDFSIFGVTGKSRITGFASVRVPAGTFRAVVVRSTLSQKGFPYGSGTRTSWFAPGKGLVKLVFAHADGSVSTVELLK